MFEKILGDGKNVKKKIIIINKGNRKKKKEKKQSMKRQRGQLPTGEGKP